MDAAYVVKGFRRGPKYVHSSNADAWRDLWEAMKGRSSAITLKWTKSYPTLHDFELYEEMPF